MASIKTNPTTLNSLSNLINESYEGNPVAIAEKLDTTIYLLHYLEEDIEKKDLQNLVFALKGLSDCLKGKAGMR